MARLSTRILREILENYFMAGGMHNVLEMPEHAAATATEQFERPDRPAAHKDWPALLRMLERRGIDYAG